MNEIPVNLQIDGVEAHTAKNAAVVLLSTLLSLAGRRKACTISDIGLVSSSFPTLIYT